VVRLLIFALALSALALSRETPLPAPEYAGRLPPGIDSGFGARLDSVCGQYLMSSRNGMLVAFAFEHGGFVPRCSLPLPDPIRTEYGSPSIGRAAAAGDVDRDGLDEIVVAGSRVIRKYEFIRGDFALTAEAAARPDSSVRPTWCFDICIGDVDNDDVNKVLVTGTDSPISFATGGYRGKTTLFVCRWTDGTLVQIWNDRGALKLEGPSWIMPITKMAGVWDPANRGTPGLLMERRKSDVRASSFDKLEWSPEGIRRDGYFVIHDGIRWGTRDNPSGAADRCDFARVSGSTATLAQVIGDPWRGEYYVFKGDTAVEHRSVWADDDFDWWSPSAGIIIDLDRKGPGILRFMYPRPKDGGPRFEFYRL
jgi:hypothetical protein